MIVPVSFDCPDKKDKASDLFFFLSYASTDCSALSLDYFGPEDESRSSSSTQSPPPGK